MSSTAIVAYLALFATVGFLFVLASLVLGRFVRAHVPTAQKLDAYECGEPSIGPGSVQFDLRFYVVALVFLIFEVEVAMFFPPATVFGKATHARAEFQATGETTAVNAPLIEKNADGQTASASEENAEENTPKKNGSVDREKIVLTPYSSKVMALSSMLDLGVFFAVLLVGFAYVWRRGDLNWVRAVRHPATPDEAVATMMKLHQGDPR
jgi:NADH-quinone oxidoreductase subunit A